MSTDYLVYIGVGAIFFLIFLHWLYCYIKVEYRKYDEEETLKEKIVEFRAKIKQAQEHFRLNYDPNVFKTVKLNLDFCIRLILNKDIKSQANYFEKLYNALYETGYRLKTKYDDVVYIIAPLKNLREELFIELTDYIKENSEGL